MNILVTGGAGFIGSHITEYLVQRGDDVTVLDNLNTGRKENLAKINDKINFVNGDIRDYKLLEKLVGDTAGVFHEAALASVQDSFNMKDEYFDVNVNGTENIFKLAKEYGFKVVYASSSSVYGNPKKIPISEYDDRKPINPYAQTKLDDEVLAKKYSEMGVRVIGLRYFNVFGPRQSKEYAGVIKLFLEKIKQKIPPKINGDGLQTRDFVHIDDVVMANILAMDSNIKHEFFNVGTGNSISILELANAIIRASSLSLEPIHGPELSGDVRATQADTTLIRKLLNWEPTIRLDDWVTKIISNKDFQYI
uniref:Putative NAD dependent epimerase/dehydratase family protein (GalE, GALE) n=1 Tax=uncultured marine thaumarchaeote SAT1000_24_E05 TaxID=1456397 RepID=A0A075I8A3_9ARCH|nr:putative NAD dependent epimerase/dehydratase family protein (galE, GALE) [uncultured marine thaumarchaeote SAT1000_24_E05]